MYELSSLAIESWYLEPRVQQGADLIREAFTLGRKLLLCGNGGSAAEAQHQAAEYVVRFGKDRAGFPAIALTTDASVLTAAGNDLDFSTVFSRQVETLGQRGDILMAYSTSGKSPNILKAIDAALDREMYVFLFTGKNVEERLAQKVHVLFDVPTKKTARIQELHLLLGHMILEQLERRGYVLSAEEQLGIFI